MPRLRPTLPALALIIASAVLPGSGVVAQSVDYRTAELQCTFDRLCTEEHPSRIVPPSNRIDTSACLPVSVPVTWAPADRVFRMNGTAFPVVRLGSSRRVTDLTARTRDGFTTLTFGRNRAAVMRTRDEPGGRFPIRQMHFGSCGVVRR